MTIFSRIKPFQKLIPEYVILDEDLIQELMESNLSEVINDYFKAMKKSIVDYVLLDEN